MKKTNVYNKSSQKPYSLSRSKIDLFFNCKRCFFLDRVCGVGQPPMFPYTLNNAVDGLMKREFDIYRESQMTPPILKENNIDAVPFIHKDLESWRESNYGKGGIKYVHEASNLEISGVVDDVWINKKKQLHVVDYKATSKVTSVSLDAPWQISYKRQVEMYNWLFEKNGFDMSPLAYFVYTNADKNAKSFDDVLKFNTMVLPHLCDTSWVEGILMNVKALLDADKIPEKDRSCEYCNYREEAGISFKEFVTK